MASRSRSSHISFTFRSAPTLLCRTWISRSTSNRDSYGLYLVSKHAEPNDVSSAIGCAQNFSRSRDVLAGVYDDAGSMIEMHELACDFTKRQGIVAENG